MGRSSSKNYENMADSETVKLHFAVVGEEGAGKSSVLSALMALPNTDEEDDQTGSTKPVMIPKEYHNPKIPFIVFWELPGIGSTKLYSKEYAKQMNMEKYDVFIIVSSCRFSKNDAKLVKEIKKLKKLFFFVRNKIDNDIHAECMKYGQLNEAYVMDKVRKDCTDNLHRLGEKSATVFLMSAFCVDKYDCGKLIDAISKDPKIIEICGNLGTKKEKTEIILKPEEAVTLHVAVIGSTGMGKSSLINALRGMSDTEEGAAATNVTECTIEPTPYKHPGITSITYWDLPGIGGVQVTPKQYLKKNKFKEYDFFIIVLDKVLKENDVSIITKVMDLKKPFFLVQSKIDEVVRAEESKGHSVCVEDILERVRKNCIHSLDEAGIKEAQVFLLSRFKLEDYDFVSFKEAISEKMTEEKKIIFELSLPILSHETIDKKKQHLKELGWGSSLFSGIIAAASPVPGASLYFDAWIIATSAMAYLMYLGLDDRSIERLARRVGKPAEKLKCHLENPLLQGKITAEVILHIILSGECLALVILKDVFKVIPIIGSIIALPVSSACTYKFLDDILNIFADTSHNVLNEALKQEMHDSYEMEGIRSSLVPISCDQPSAHPDTEVE